MPGVIESDQFVRVAVNVVRLSDAWSVQVPLIWRPTRFRSAVSGWNDPVNGAEPRLIENGAASSKVVLAKSCPPPVDVWCLARRIGVPSGAISVRIRPLGSGAVIERLTVTLATTWPAGNPATATVDGTLIRLTSFGERGIVFGTSVETKVCGPLLGTIATPMVLMASLMVGTIS